MVSISHESALFYKNDFVISFKFKDNNSNMFDYKSFLEAAYKEDVGPGDYSTLASIPADLQGEAIFIYKDKGVVAGIQEVKNLAALIDDQLQMTFDVEDGTFLTEHTVLG